MTNVNGMYESRSFVGCRVRTQHVFHEPTEPIRLIYGAIKEVLLPEFMFRV